MTKLEESIRHEINRPNGLRNGFYTEYGMKVQDVICEYDPEDGIVTDIQVFTSDEYLDCQYEGWISVYPVIESWLNGEYGDDWDKLCDDVVKFVVDWITD